MLLMNKYEQNIQEQRDFFIANLPFSFDYRKQQLISLKKAIQHFQQDLNEALALDLGKPEFESYMKLTWLLKN